MPSTKYHLVLGSGSPRRKELLGRLSIPFSQITADIEEQTNHTDPALVVEDLARQKAKAIIEQGKLPNHSLLITSDTIVSLQGKILGKPHDKKEARVILSQLSGKTHQVYTGVFLSGESEHFFFVKTDVTFEKITNDLMDYYLTTDEPMDKAGAYGIQGFGLLFVKEIQGSYSNVVGFPLSDVVIQLKKYLNLKENEDLRDYFHND